MRRDGEKESSRCVRQESSWDISQDDLMIERPGQLRKRSVNGETEGVSVCLMDGGVQGQTEHREDKHLGMA